ncbi:MAG: 2-oxoacid:acceptor oxidoreductase subunit alpha, partial [Halanaerobiaceae bacterium]|nr:2-oxoacid:acceptor oxidoreductase subunit alpha [Halanaerobiaceae bacterium]
MDLTIVISGEAGQGLETTSFILGKSLFRMGYNVFTSKDYMSIIRGSLNFSTIRFSTGKLRAVADMIDILIALNAESVEVHKD